MTSKEESKCCGRGCSGCEELGEKLDKSERYDFTALLLWEVEQETRRLKEAKD